MLSDSLYSETAKRKAIYNSINNSQNKKKNAGVLKKLFDTSGDLSANVVSGLGKGIEGIYDFGAGIVGAIGGIFDKDFKDRVQDHIAYDFVGTHITNPLQELFNDSYLNDWGTVGEIIEGTFSGVGQMLPAIALTTLTAGAGASTMVAQGVGLATTGVSAAGSATESAYNDGADYYSGLAYGAASGAIEAATEKLGGKIFGNSPIDDALKIAPAEKTLFKAATTKTGKILQGMASEGIEEIAAEIANPASKMIYKGTDALQEYKNGEFWGEVGKAGAIGALTSAVYGGTVGQIGKNTQSANESLSELRSLDVKEENLFANGKLFEGGREQQIEKLRNQYKQELSESVSKMKPEKRAKYIEQNKLGSILNQDGSLIQDIQSNSQVDLSSPKGGNNGLASSLDKRYYSVSAKGQEQNIINSLESQNVEVFKGELTQQEQENYNRFKKAQLALSRKGLVRQNFAISNQSTNFDSYLDGKLAVFGKDLFESDAWQKKLMHEVEHFTEGSKEWAEFAEFVMNETNLSNANAEILERSGYGITQADIDSLAENLKKNALTDKQKLYLSEAMAFQSETLFGNEQMIERLTRENRTIAQKMLDRIKDFIKVLKAKTPEEKNFIKKLQQAERLFEKALNVAGQDYIRKEIDKAESVEKLDKTDDVRYARTTQYTESQYKRFGWVRANNVLTSTQWNDFNSKFKKPTEFIRTHKTANGEMIIPVNNMIGESFGVDNVMVFVKGTYQSPNITKIVEINLQDETSIDYVRRFIYDNETRANNQTSIALKDVFGEELITELSARDFQDYQAYKGNERTQGGRNDGGNNYANNNEQQRGTSNTRQTSYSLKKDSQGNQLTEEQVEFFKNSKVRDYNGNLLVMYHGTSNLDFNEFDVKKSTNTFHLRNLGVGNYFTTSKSEAKTYSTDKGRIISAYLNIKNPYIIKSDRRLYTNDVLEDIAKKVGITYEELISNGGRHVANDYLKKAGYDGVVLENQKEFGYTVVAFESNQIKNTTNLNPTKSSDIRYSLSKAQATKNRANNTKMKVYNKLEAEILINEVIDNQLNADNKFGVLKGKTKAEAIEQLFVALNSTNEGYQTGAALRIADYIIENAIFEDIYEDAATQEYMKQYDIINAYRGKFNLDAIKGELKHRFDDKTNAIIMQWGKRKGERGTTADVVAMELQEQGIYLDGVSEAELFMQIYDTYTNAAQEIKKASKKVRADYFKPEELKKMRQEIARDILKGFDKYGRESKHAELIKQYTDKIKFLKEQIKDLKERNKSINNLFATIDKVAGLEKFKSAEIELADEVVGLVKLLKKVKTYRNNLSKNIREIMNTYSSTNAEGKKLYDLIANNGDGIDNPVAQMIEDIAHKRGELSTTEIKQLDLIMQNFIHNVNEYNRVFFEGRVQSDEKIAEQAVIETRETIPLKTSGFMGSMSKFTRWLTAPVWRFERLSSYKQDGVMTKIFGELQQGVDKQARFNMQVAEHFKEFFKSNKKTVLEWNKPSFEIGGKKLSRGQVITLYMLFQREQARGHLLSKENGTKGTIRVANEKYASKGDVHASITEGVDVDIEISTLNKIENSLTDTEKSFIKLAKEFFDKISKDAKYETDMALFGISNVGEENYIPIRVADDQIYKQLGSEKLSFSELFSVYNASFNKETRPNANNKIVVENIIDIINRHSKQMASYYGLAVPLKSFNRIYNKKLADGSKLSIEINKVDPDFEKYVSKLLGDMQGRGNPRTFFDKVISKIRGLGAKAALGLNLKVLANQFVSLPAAKAVGVEYKHLAKGFAMATARKTDFDKLTEYCPMLYERFREGSNIDVGLLKESQGVVGKLDALTDLTTAPIGKIDKLICGAVWNACLEQTKDSTKYKDYSHEHYTEAAKLTEKAVIKTQSNYTALYRPAMLREQNSFLQLSTMFMSEPLQQLSLLASSLDKITLAKKLLKQNNTPENQALLKQAKFEATNAITAVAFDMMLLALIAQAFKWVKGQDDEETFLEGITSELTANFIGMFPFIKDIYSLLEGYDVTNMAYTGLTNIVYGVKEMWNIVDLLASGEQYSDAQITSKLRKVLIGISQTFGIPLRNLETYTKGIIEKFAPSLIYRYDSIFNNSSLSYTSDLNKAIENGDDKLADTIIDIMLNEKSVQVEDEKTRLKLKELYEQGLNVFPRSVGSKIIHDSESVELTKKQRERFVEIYSRSNDKISSLIGSKGFNDMPAVVQASSIKYIYDYYYQEALKDLLGVDSDEKKYLFAQAIDIVKLAKIVAQASQLTSDEEDGKVVSGSKKAKIVALINSSNLTAVQKYMLMGYFGYKNTKGETQVKLYIQSLKLTKTEKETLFKMSGY